ncbi:hypothetical protein PET_TAIDAONE_77 [Streptomyces phage TaidaOne]|uniref:Uncharacterized protein n=1 Tax=Streptomyces phage TaidaOne TaxID=2836025 RepID=A0A8F3IN58_9CAUD|nr:hypothetical protein PET_TAIDAONE_77 [Streptomyces phage TaidaOne]
MSDRKMALGDILSQEGLRKREAGLPHITKEQIENLRVLLMNDVSLYEEFFTLVKCGLEEYQDSTSSVDQISEKIATCLLLVVKGSL